MNYINRTNTAGIPPLLLDMLYVTERFFHHPAVVCVCVCVRYKRIDTGTRQRGFFDHSSAPNAWPLHTRARQQSHPISHYTVKRIAGCQYGTHTHTHAHLCEGFLFCRSAQSKHTSPECLSLSKHLVAGFILETVVTATDAWLKLVVQVCLFTCVLLDLNQSEYVIRDSKKQSACVMWNKWDWSHLVIKNMPTEDVTSYIWLHLVQMQKEICMKQQRCTHTCHPPARHLWLIVQLEH